MFDQKKLAPLCLFASLIVTGCSGLTPGPGPSDPDAPTEFTTTSTGLQYRILRKTDGKKPNEGSSVKVNYIGKLDDGTVFDSSYARGKPAIFALPSVVAGWREGMKFVGEGGMIELIVPPELGYGEAGAKVIPPNSTLHFVVELIRVF